jgi:hypothetical protein
MRGCDPVPRAIGFDMKLENSEQRKCQLINNEKITHAHDRYEMRDRLMAENISSNFDQQTNEVQICLLHNIHVKLSGSKERDENLRLPSCAEIVKMKIGNISSIGQYAKRGRYLDNHLNVKNFCISDPVSFENSCSVYNQTLPASPYCMPGYHWFKHKESIPICENYTEVILVEETTPSEIYSVQQ